MVNDSSDMAGNASNTSNNIRQYADIAVTYTANEFRGIYRGKQYHEPDFEDVLSRAQAVGCTKIMLTTMTLDGARKNLDTCRTFPGLCYMTLGVHPYHASEIYTTDTNNLDALITLGKSLVAEQDSPLVSFGEIGLDYHYLDRSGKEDQQRAFISQLEIATTHFPTLPLFLHARDATADFIDIIRPFLSKLPAGPNKGVIHSFAGSQAEMLQLVDLGFHISVNGISFKTQESLDMVRAIPLSHLQLETDAPWCSMPSLTSCPAEVGEYLKDAPALPSSKDRRKFVKGSMVKDRNESCVIERVARVVAGVQGVELDTVVRTAWENSTKMFGLGVCSNT